MGQAALQDARDRQHAAALAGDTKESSAQLRRVFHLQGHYASEVDRCLTCGARAPDHPAAHYSGMARGTCEVWKDPTELAGTTPSKWGEL